MKEMIALLNILAILCTSCVRAFVLRRGSAGKGGPAETEYVCNGRHVCGSGDCQYKFRLEKRADGYRCYILRTPSYRGRSQSYNVAHYFEDSRGRYICYTASIPYLAQAKTLCQQWSNMTQRYIETGRRFEDP